MEKMHNHSARRIEGDGAIGADSRPPLLENLESRTLYAVTMMADGWTKVTPSGDTRMVYVSSSGNDNNNGLSSSKPVKSLAKATSLLRSGKPDWLLLKAGDTFNGTFPQWTKSGRSSSEPMLITSYGSGARPVIRAGDDTALETGRTPVKHLKIIGLHFYAHTRDPYSSGYKSSNGGYGMQFLGNESDLLVEDCVIDNFKTNISFYPYYGPHKDMTVRRSVITDAYFGNGLYSSGVNGLLVEENVFDNNGWNAKVSKPGAIPGHNIYIQSTNKNTTVRGNIIANAGSHGLQARTGGVVKDNLFLNNPIGMSFGIVNGAAAVAGGVEGTVSGNIILGNGEVKYLKGRGEGYAIEFGNIKKATFKNNIIANGSFGSHPAIFLTIGHDVENAGQQVGINNFNIEGNIVHNWHKAMYVNSKFRPGGKGASALNNLRVQGNHFQDMGNQQVVYHGPALNTATEKWSNNRYYRGKGEAFFYAGGTNMDYDEWHEKYDRVGSDKRVKYFQAGRSIEAYSKQIGGSASASSFLNQARKQSRRSWDSDYTAGMAMKYIGAGFTDVKGPTQVVATNLSSRNLQPARKSISFFFSQDVSSTISKNDLVLENRATGQVISLGAMNMTYDKLNHSATWSFPGLSGGRLSAGKWKVTLIAPGIKVDGKSLDGDYDAAAGDDFVMNFTIKPRA